MAVGTFLSNREETPEQRHQCRKVFGGRFRPICRLSVTVRLAVIPLVWWGVFGFGGPSGAQLVRDYFGLSPVASAAVTALLLAVVSAVTLLPCHVHRRWMHGREAACGEKHV